MPVKTLVVLWALVLATVAFRAPPRNKALRMAAGFGKAPQQKPTPIGQVELSKKFHLVYTCNKCETRNAIKVSRAAWGQGVVVGKCHGCGARHLLADPTGLTDITNSTKFSDAWNDALRRGQAPRRLTTKDPEVLKAAGIAVLPDGNISLIPQEGETIQKTADDDTGRVLAVKGTAPPRVVEEQEIIVTNPELRPHKDVVDEAIDPPTVELPPQIEVGGDLTMRIPDGRLVHVNIPRGAEPGMILRVEGLVEVPTPAGTTDGDVLAINLPGGDDARVLLQGAEAVPGTVVNIGFPLTLLDKTVVESPTTTQETDSPGGGDR
eukprot:CAMPEP_0198660618 /NCGR_PEP_ID=MMETSP1467-20131203/37751_1 /TAXON_ID=1462469 /ORGANISM="unid. sp., Strain CCMP2135" /LENGTH=320 /DNA_ID=CAMNT_0044397027 /DNA_START=1 /DNA_END=963 /DNA_ORIENTATION=-